jgi:hypothetical protein
MLLDLRHNQNNNFIRTIFLLTAMAMLLGSVVTAFVGQSNPVLLKSSVSEIRRKDLFSRSQPWALIFQQLNISSKDDVPSLLNQYLLPKIYQDFFTHYHFEMSDKLAWSLFLQRFQNETLSAEKMQRLQQAIQQQFGSKTEFLKQLKTQLYNTALQEALSAIAQPLVPDFDIQHDADKLQRHTHIYTYLPQDFYADIIEPSAEDCATFYESHIAKYTLMPTLNLEYVLLTPSYITLPESNTPQYEHLAADIQARGYQEVTSALMQQVLYHQLIEKLNSTDGLTSLSDVAEFLQQYGVSYNSLSSKNFDSINEEQLDDLFEQPGLYNVAATLYTSNQKSFQHYPLSEEQELLMVIKSHDAGGPQPLERVHYQVVQDLKKELAFQRALQKAQNDCDNYTATAELSSFERYKNYKNMIVTDIFAEQRLNNEMKVALSTLYDPRLKPSKSSMIIAAEDSDHINVIALTHLSQIEQLSTESANTDKQPRFNLQEFAQKEMIHHLVDKDLYADFGYQIVSPEFWSFVARA